MTLESPYYPDHDDDVNPRDPDTGEWLNQDRIKEVKRFLEFRSVDWLEEELREHRTRLNERINSRNANRPLVNRLFSSILNWLVLSVMGIIIGLIAGCLNVLTAWLSSIRFGHCSNHFFLDKAFCCRGQGESCDRWVNWSAFGILNFLLYMLISATFAYSSGILVKRIAPFAAGSGISEIKCIISGFVMKGFLGWRTLFMKSICLPLAISSGLSVGKEGPSVHYAVCVGNNITKLFEKYKNSVSKSREFLTATSAAGVAVAFGSPMGGVLFSIEEISSTFSLSTIWKSYFCSLIAVSTLASLNPFGTGQVVLFEVKYDSNWHYFEIPIYILLGIFGGIYGIIVSKLNLRVVAFRKKFLSNFAIREIMTLVLLTTSFSYFNEFLRFDMTETMQVLFQDCKVSKIKYICDAGTDKLGLVVSLLFATIARMFLTIITYGCKVPAGIFVPSMAAGATFGRALGIIVEQIALKYPDSLLLVLCGKDNGKCIIPGTYAFLGSAAALSGITHLTVSVVIIMFELTGALRYIIPTMIVVAITKTINDKYGKGGIADQAIVFNGLPYIDPNEEFEFKGGVDKVMSSRMVVLPSGADDPITVNYLKSVLEKTKMRGFPVVASPSDPRISGYVSRSELELVVKEYASEDPDKFCVFDSKSSMSMHNSIALDHLINQHPIIIDINTDLPYVYDIFVKLGTRIVLVQSGKKLVGLITRKDMLRYSHTAHFMKGHNAVEDNLDDVIWKHFCTISMKVKEWIRNLTNNHSMH